MKAQSLQQVATDIWCLDSHFRALGCKGSLRMSVVATSQGLVLYSPVSLTRAHIQQIDDLGYVSAIVAPSLYHHFFLRECAAIYRDAHVFVPQGLTDKIGPVAGAHVIDNESSFSAQGELEHFTFTGHALQETILYHPRSRTLITADLLYNYTADQFPAERAFFRMIGCYGPKIAFYHRFSVKDKASVAELVRRVNSWQVERIVMSHGRILSDPRAGALFAAAWSRMARLPPTDAVASASDAR
ncbi:hypothetical protein HNP52_003056 [Sphingomonas kyeonggiensis]|uniref:DUF4336 domain-containing protein n=1 Tax=Sphingomonas kyeonggiensis TaxID=1268553 RepID=A0A7W7K2S5_9SPHN|nr:DUF4336 domain-containing protein [Sphingomonas kyeonggiensis]MBB4839964.1 hypothetical protein [Sphingomonas kyeonggiensis]